MDHRSPLKQKNNVLHFQPGMIKDVYSKPDYRLMINLEEPREPRVFDKYTALRVKDLQ